MNIFEKMAGGEMVQFNNSFFLSEKTSMDRDFSLAYFMRENKCFPPGADIKKILEFYFQVGTLKILQTQFIRVRESIWKVHKFTCLLKTAFFFSSILLR